MTIHLRPYQSTDITRIRAEFAGAHRAVLYVAPTGSGKCLGIGTPVLMFNGSVRPVETIRVGDVIMGPDSGPRIVKSTCAGVGNLYRVVPLKGAPYVVNEDHILCLSRTRQRLIPRSKAELDADDLVEITVRDYVGKSSWFKHLHKGVRTGVEFQPHAEPIKVDPYFLGLWLGDGLSRHASIVTEDIEVANYTAEYAVSIGMEVRVTSDGKCPVHHIVERDRARGPNQNRLLQALRHYNLVLNKHIPTRYKTGSRRERLELLAGLLDSDGRLSCGEYDLTLKNERLFDDAVFLARSLGFSCYKSECKKVCTNNGVVGNYFRCNINGAIDTIPCRVGRRIASPRRQKKSVLVTGISVEPTGVGQFFGFELSGADGRFLLGDFTITHNTVLFTYIASQMAAKGRRCWIMVHRQELLGQTSRALTAFGVDHGIISPQFTMDPRAPLQVASVQTLIRRLDKVTAPDLIILDEAHHAISDSWRKVIDAHPKAKVLGVTATPERLDARGLREVFSAMVIGPSVKTLTDAGYLAPATIFAPPQLLDMRGVAKRGGDYAKDEMAKRVDTPTITGDSVAHYSKICSGVPAIAFCASVLHAEHVAAQFRDAGFRSCSVDGSLDDRERKRRIDGLASGAVQVLTSCDLVSEGLDIPAVGAAILLRPTHSLALARQQIGRALRPMPGKARAIILDHVGSCVRHGLPTDEIEWSLDGAGKRAGTAGDKVAAVRQCSECYRCYEAYRDHCPECGFVPEIKSRVIGQTEGELVEMREAEQIEMFRKKADLARRIKEAKTLADFEKIGREMGYAKGWAWFRFSAVKKYREKYRRTA